MVYVVKNVGILSRLPGIVLGVSTCGSSSENCPCLGYWNYFSHRLAEAKCLSLHSRAYLHACACARTHVRTHTKPWGKTDRYKSPAPLPQAEITLRCNLYPRVPYHLRGALSDTLPLLSSSPSWFCFFHSLPVSPGNISLINHVHMNAL